MSEVWRRSQGRTGKAPPDERGGNRYARPTATAPHLDSTGPTPNYAMLMRIGAVARSGGDLPNAVGTYRRAADMAPQDPAPLIAAGDVLLQMGAVNEAIVSYNQALVRPGDTQGAQIAGQGLFEDGEA
jgi:predicted Zn-dependent protease